MICSTLFFARVLVVVLGILIVSTTSCGRTDAPSETFAGSEDSDSAIKKQAAFKIGKEPSDADIRRACQLLEDSEWDYPAAAKWVREGGWDPLRFVDIMEAIVNTVGGETQDFCSAKLAGPRGL